MSRESDKHATQDMMQILMPLLQQMDNLDEEERHRVLDTIYAFYGMKPDPSFRMSDVTSLIERIVGIIATVGPQFANSAEKILEQMQAQKGGEVFGGLHAVPEVTGTPIPDEEARHIYNQTPYHSFLIIGQAMARKEDPRGVAELIYTMIDYHNTFGTLLPHLQALYDAPADAVARLFEPFVEGLGAAEYLAAVGGQLAEMLRIEREEEGDGDEDNDE